MPSLDEHAQPGSWRTGLTAKQAKFVEYYLLTLNGAEAARQAGYSKNSAYAIASENLRKPEIAAAIDKALAEDPGVTRTRIVDELARIAFANAGDFFEWGPDGVTVKSSSDLTEDQRAVVAEVSQTVTKEGGTIRVKLADKMAALDRLGRATRLFADKLEVTGRDGEPLVPESASPRELARVVLDIIRTANLEALSDHEMEPAGSCPSPAAPTTRARAPSGASASTGAASGPEDRPGNLMPRLSPKRKTITRKSKR